MFFNIFSRMKIMSSTKSISSTFESKLKITSKTICVYFLSAYATNIAFSTQLLNLLLAVMTPRILFVTCIVNVCLLIFILRAVWLHIATGIFESHQQVICIFFCFTAARNISTNFLYRSNRLPISKFKNDY